MTATRPVPTTLIGRHVRLEPLDPRHLPDLFAAGGRDEEVWRWQDGPAPRSEEELAVKLRGVLAKAEDGQTVPFAVVHRAQDRAVGWTCYMDVDVEHERLEIGRTWYGRAHWRTAVNTESKLLLLSHAFEELGMGRVQLKTDHLNHRSQAAIARLGARREGVLRRHRRRPDGTWRDTVYFSLLADEWPRAKERLAARLRAGWDVRASGGTVGPVPIGPPGDAVAGAEPAPFGGRPGEATAAWCRSGGAGE